MHNLKPFLSLADPHPQPNLTKVEYALIHHFSLLSKDQRSYRSLFTPKRLRRHIFYLPPLGKVVGILEDKGKQPVDEGLQRKRKRVISIESDEFIPGEGLMADARCAGREEEFFRINRDADPSGRLANRDNNITRGDRATQGPASFEEGMGIKF